MAHFNSVWWLGYEWAIFGYPKTSHTFITKQVSGWCGCNSKLSLWEETVINRCPQCGCKNETSKHLTRCTDPGCLLQLHDSIEAIMDIMNNANITSELADMIETYLLNQGWQTIAECTKPTSTYLYLAISINKLGWDCFMQGCIPISLIDVIKPMFHCYKLKGLIALTHKQWLYRNNDVHYVSEGLTLRQHEELTTKIKILMKTKHSALLGRHRHYMSTNFDKLGRRPTIARQVWVANMEMAISIAKVAKETSAHRTLCDNFASKLPYLPTNNHHQFLSLASPLALLHTSTICHSSHRGQMHATLGYPRLRIHNPSPPTAHQPHLTSLPCSLFS